MKKYIYLSLFLLLFFSGCDEIRTGEQQKVTYFSDLAASFKYPPSEYSTVPFWVWNDKVTKEKIDRQLAMFKEQGIYQVFIHPRPGLITEYLSEEWFKLWQYALNKAKDLEMNLWLYDENSFPSGFAGGHVPARMPPGADPVAGLKLSKLEILTKDDSDKYLIILKKIGDTFANISNAVPNYLNDPGEYYAFSKWYYPGDQGLFGGFSYVDLLAYGITERFIHITMEGYEKILRAEFGKTVPGIFTDEPHINTTRDPSVIKFTPVLFSRFEEEYGYPLTNYLPCLYEETGDWKNVRHDYYSLLLDMFIERWAKPWYAYTDTNGLKWTGHYWEHTWPNPRYGGDNMAMCAWHHYPGIDMLFNNEKVRPDQFGNIRAVKEASSVANQLGKERILSETYGAAGWELTFEDMKRLGDWEYTLGINLMNQHLSYMTLKGARKRDFPQSMSYHTPWWEHYRTLNEYFHRLSFVLSSGDQVNTILVLEPTTTAWMEFSPEEGKAYLGVKGQMAEFQRSFDSLLDRLENFQVEYDLGSERIIRDHGKVENDRFVVGERAYDLILLPPGIENLQSPTHELLLQYLQNGGSVVSLAGYPSRLDGNLSNKLKNSLVSDRYKWTNYDSLTAILLKQLSRHADFIPIDPEHWKGRVFHHRRQLQDGQIIFFSNFDTIQTAHIHFEVPGESIAEMDILSGEIFRYRGDNKNEMYSIEFKLPPAGSKLFFVAQTELDYPEADKPAIQVGQEIDPGKTTITRNGPNVLNLDYCNVEVAGKQFNNIYFYNAADSVFKEHTGEIYGFNYNPWSVAIQYRTNVLDHNKTFDAATGYKISYTFSIEEGFQPEEIKAVIERPALYHVACNGQSVTPIEGEWWLDREFGIFDIADILTPGENIITLEIQPMNILAEPEPVYIIGNFNLRAEDEGWSITDHETIETGSWKDQGMPFYSESISYRKSVDFNQNGLSGIKIRLNEWSGTLTEVRINDEKAGIIAWPPYELDITGAVVDGKNEIEVKVYGSLKNLLGPHHNDPVSGVVTPWSFFYAPLDQPPGAEYDLFDYGLFKDYSIIEYTY